MARRAKRKEFNSKVESRELKADDEDFETTDEENFTNQQESEPETSSSGKMFWLAGSLFVVAVAIFLRFYDLLLKPFHHDEGVNGFFLARLVRENIYKYDPGNYHGPTLYFFALFSSYLFGLNDFAVRFVTAAFGVLTVILVLYLRRYLGTIGTLFAALLVAVCAGQVFISRYFIHEILFIFFTFGIVVAVVKFWENKKIGEIGIGLMTLLLLVCLLPGTFNLAKLSLQILNVTTDGANDNSLLVARLIFFVVEAGLVFLLLRSLLLWNEGKPIYLLLAAASCALLFATKETAFVSLGTMLLAIFCVWGWQVLFAKESSRRIVLLMLVAALPIAAIYFAVIQREKLGLVKYYETMAKGNLNGGLLLLFFIAFCGLITWLMLGKEIWQTQNTETTWQERIALNAQNFRLAMSGNKNLIWLIVGCLVVFAYVGALFFSSFFTNYEGVWSAFEAYSIWSKTGTKDHADNGLFVYFKWVGAVEAPIFILGAIGALIALWKGKHRLAIFTAFWAWGLTAAYTLIPYKTPWLALNFTLPLCLISGYGINELALSRQKWQKLAAVLLAVGALGFCTYKTIELNFYRYDDDSMPYVYAHTKRGFKDLLAEIDRVAKETGRGKDLGIVIVSPEYWGMPWHLRDYSRAGFYGHIEPVKNFNDYLPDIIIAQKNKQEAEVEAEYGELYEKTGEYPLRPGVDLMVYELKK